jgi:hypothetical protein
MEPRLPSRMFPHPESAQHGNFSDRSYRAILANPDWNCRLNKHHAQIKALPPAPHGHWRELDSCNSSDALLMNVFCYPGVLRRPAVSRLLGTGKRETPQFGLKARVPLSNGRTDQTEVDLQLGELLIEAKLTETSFQTRAKNVVEGYRDFSHIFERKCLPQSREQYFSYQ